MNTIVATGDIDFAALHRELSAALGDGAGWALNGSGEGERASACVTLHADRFLEPKDTEIDVQVMEPLNPGDPDSMPVPSMEPIDPSDKSKGLKLKFEKKPTRVMAIKDDVRVQIEAVLAAHVAEGEKRSAAATLKHRMSEIEQRVSLRTLRSAILGGDAEALKRLGAVEMEIAPLRAELKMLDF